MEKFSVLKRSPTDFYILKRDDNGSLSIASDAIDAITREPVGELGDPIFASRNAAVLHPYRQDTFRDYVKSVPSNTPIVDPLSRRTLFPDRRAFSLFDDKGEAERAEEPENVNPGEYVFKGPVVPMGHRWAVMWIIVA